MIQTVGSVITLVSDYADTLYGIEEGSPDNGPSRTQASSSIVRSLESQISSVARNVTDLNISLPSLAVIVVTLKTYEQEETQFLSVLNEGDADSSILQPGGVQTVPKGGERGCDGDVMAHWQFHHITSKHRYRVEEIWAEWVDYLFTCITHLTWDNGQALSFINHIPYIGMYNKVHVYAENNRTYDESKRIIKEKVQRW